MGRSPKAWVYNDARFYIQPQGRLNWQMFQVVTFAIMEVLDKVLHRETKFTILGDNYEGNLGWGYVRNAP